jgi:hypothetical protein
VLIAAGAQVCAGKLSIYISGRLTETTHLAVSPSRRLAVSPSSADSRHAGITDLIDQTFANIRRGSHRQPDAPPGA